jgi:ATP-dependent Zn protease
MMTDGFQNPGGAFNDTMRCAGHEAGHVIVRRMLGTPVEGCTIDPDVAGPGLNGCVWSPNSREATSPEDYAAQRLTELAGGVEAERLLWPNRAPKFARSDTRKAVSFANQVCDGSRKSVAALLEFATIEARRILAVHKAALEAVALALLERQTLDGTEIDQIILEAELSPALRVEKLRRKQMAEMTAAAEAFCTAHGGLTSLALR